MVRDDFWLAVSRFMKAMEIEIREGHNSALVDLFDLLHARRVLAAFGQAYGRLPDDLGQCSQEQNAFLEQAVAGLAQDGKVISVRLALFAEMLKGRPWTPGALKEVGGTEGVGVAFLEETFCAATAPPDHRYHQKAAPAVLRALLPESGTNIRGHMRSQQELLEASGYAGRPQDFADLIRVLDSELRLITPTEPEGKDDGPAAAAAGAKYYQLTHDYLVPSLRDWLTRKQKQTRRGRATLCLAERAALWDAKRQNRNLPAWWEWLYIRLFTRANDWTAPQQQMMHRAGRRLALRAALLAAGLMLLTCGRWEAFGRFRARELMGDLLRAPTRDVPAVVREMAASRRWLDGRLREMYAAAESQGDTHKQLRLGLALLPVDDGQVEYLIGRLLLASPAEVVAIRDSLGPHAPAACGRLWAILEDRRADPGQRLRAACFLALHAPHDGRWEQASGDVALRLVTENALLLKEWAEALRPVAPALLPALAGLVAESRTPSDLRTRAGLYAEFAASRPQGFALLESVLSEMPADVKEERVLLARRQATAAAGLASVGRWETVWPLLRHAADPTRRTYLIERLGTSGVEAREIIDRLNPEQEPDVSARRALVLALADCEDERLPPAERQRLLPRLLEGYRDDPDPGLHGALGWLLRQWGQQEQAHAVDRELVTGSLQGQRRWYVGVEGQTMVAVPPGEIAVQGPFGQPRKVAAGRRWAVGAREVTVAEFLRFRKNHAVERRSAHTDDCPVNEVSWYDAAAYCNWLSKQEGIPEDQWCYLPNAEGQYAAGMKVKANALDLAGYRLPTGQEWEYACRAGSLTRWSMGDGEDMLSRYAWSMLNAGMRSRPVLLRPNDLGLFDLQGNVWEWCQDRYDGRDMEEDAAASQGEDVVDDSSFRRLCGGTFLNDPVGVSCATHNRNQAAHRTGADGFRVARTLP
jgi:formylglycine-generating enzyme required for sulfatase activity